MSSFNNVIKSFIDVADKLGDGPCAHFKVNDKWESKSWRRVSGEVTELALGLMDLGLSPGDSVILLGQTRLEWAIADFAIMACRGVCVPVYHTFNAERIATIIREVKPKMAIVEDKQHLSLFDAALDLCGLKGTFNVIAMEDVPGFLTMAKLISKKHDSTQADLKTRIESISEGDTATCVYTSGTTGDLKGALITHGNVAAEIEGSRHVFLFGHDQIGLLWLPLAHVLGRMMEIYGFVHGTQTAFTSDVTRLPEIYKEIRPHFVCGVPRMLDKVYEQVMEYIECSRPPIKALFKWALRVGKKRSKYIQRQRRIGLFLGIKYRIADLLVFGKLKGRLGGRLWCFICGGAKLSEEVARFFHATGITVLEGYGLTETFAAATVNRLDDFHFGTVGKPIQGVDIKLAPDREVLIKGSIVFKGYIDKPVETKEAFDKDGWFMTGDLGEYSRDGFLRITGRKKEIIITAGGKNIAPQMIESMLVDSPYIDHAMIYGDGRKYLTALITVNQEAAKDYLERHGSPENLGPHHKHPAIDALIGREVESVNSKLAKFETIKRFTILDKSLSIDGGELTPTLKLRRTFITEKYSHVLDSMY